MVRCAPEGVQTVSSLAMDMMRRPGSKTRATLVATTLAMLGSGVVRAQPDNMTLGELALTPPVCQDVQGIPATGWVQHFRHSPRTGYWVGMLGDTFWAMHHYCWALIWLHRASAAGVQPALRDHWRRTAIADFYYVVRFSKAEFVLLPELYYRIGEVHRLLREPGKALDAFQKSREIKPDYWPAYAGLSDTESEVGRLDAARAHIKAGLELMPQEPALLARMRALDEAKTAGARRTAPARPAALAADKASVPAPK